MALSSQVEAAAHTPREPKGILIFDRDHSQAPKVDDADRRSFAVGLCGTAIRHECTANEPNEGDPCTHPLHGQDRDNARMALILAGLVPDPFPSKERERKMSPNVTPLPGVIRAKKRREAEAANPPAPLPDLSWQIRGLCRGEDPDLFYAAEGERQAERAVREKQAKAVCRGCPVASACLKYALDRREQGVWGGTSDDERANLRRRKTWREKAA